ncbi:MAG: sensor domain-containing diguanylate cyclase [Nitrospiraceae bacterium]|nr:sensor domain-containing diguanylate cyclase [Nitrospiraceae bacterium]
MHKCKIAVYDRDTETLKFLKDFFKDRKEYSASFFRDVSGLQEGLSSNSRCAVIAGTNNGCLGETAPLAAGFPVVAMVEKDLTRGLSQVMRHNLEFYLMAPFHKDDLDYKLKVLRNRQNFSEGICSKVKDLEAIVELAYLMSSTLDPREVLDFMVKRISSTLEVNRCFIIGLTHGEKRYAQVVSTFEAPELKEFRLDLKKYPEIRRAHRIGRPVIVKDARKDPLMKPVSGLMKALDIKAIMVVPIVYRDEVIGSLFLRTTRNSRPFTEREKKFCQEIARAAVNPLYNAFLFEKLVKEKTRLERLSITDYLTGAYNIRYLYHRLEDEFQRARRYGSPLSCIMFDLDHFKKINDSYGHKAGDMVLREFAHIVKRQVRKTDVFARYGGEEFVLLLTHTPVNGALTEADRLRDLIRTHRYRALDEKSGVTVSMGISTYPDARVAEADGLITLADDALFKAKNRGRDQIILA